MNLAAPLNHNPQPELQWAEIASSLHIPSFQIIGLPAPEVNEARERIRAAIEASGFGFPKRRVILNLSPSSIRKRGTGADLAMALAILVSAEKDQRSWRTTQLVAWGELGLSGAIKPSGQLTRAIFATWQAKIPYLVLAETELEQAKIQLALLQASKTLPGPPPCIVGFPTLAAAWDHFVQDKSANRKPALSATISPGALEWMEKSRIPSESPHYPHDFDGLMSLTPSMERVLGTSLSGHHHVLLLGPRGAGKSHALEWMIALQPPASPEIEAENAILHELTDPLSPEVENGKHSLHYRKNIRRIGPQARPAALLGRTHSNHIRAGELSLANGGLLIADEILEWARDTREVLREPLERGKITLTRVGGNFELPARFILAANGNLCSCGGWPSDYPLPLNAPHSIPLCKCSIGSRKKYLAKLSGPILDRIDLVLLIPTVTEAKPPHLLALPETELRSRLRELRKRIQATQTLATQLWGKTPGTLPGSALEQLLRKRPDWHSSLEKLGAQSLRSRHKILRLAMTLSVWDGHEGPKDSHLFEAACYRPERLGLFG